MAAFRTAVEKFSTVPQSNEEWQNFLRSIVTAHGTDLESVQQSAQQGERGERKTAIILDKTYRPDRYSDDRDPKSRLTFKQWSSDVRSVMKRYNADYCKMMDTAIDRNNWNSVDVMNELKEDYNHEIIRQANEEIFEYLKTVTEGDARAIVDANEDSGIEAWWRLFHRFRPRGLRGATEIADKIQGIKKPVNTANTFAMLQKSENDVREFSKASQGEPMPSAIIRAAMLKCVPTVIENAVKLQIDIDTIETATFRNKLEQHAKAHVDNGPKPMDIGAVTGAEPPREVPHEPATENPEQPGIWYDDKGNAVVPQEQLELYGLKGQKGGKGKDGGGKGKFGGCALCGEMDHWKNECPRNPNKGRAWTEGKRKKG